MEASFDLEWAAFGARARSLAIERPIFVCGLARAGTSLVTRLVASAPQVASPRYRDMPFPLAPNLWSRLAGRRAVVASERGHSDGMLHDLDTPEALEEALWRCFEGPRYLKAETLADTPPRRETLDLLRRYIALILLRGAGSRYVSKNNNNVLRVTALASTFPDALFVHPFRHPQAQARSLAEQHARTIQLQRADGFRLDYANWLGHHEFGLGRRAFAFDGVSTASEDWLGAWRAVYGRLLDQAASARARQFFLDYDRLCADPVPTLDRLDAFLGLGTARAVTLRPRLAETAPVPAAAQEIYDRLRERSVST